MFTNVRVLGVPVPFHRNFEEVNLRFYVRHYDNGEWKRGVVFIKELVPRVSHHFHCQYSLQRALRDRENESRLEL
jgi:uncharacterized protein YqjF (DUF2071 family)